MWKKLQHVKAGSVSHSTTVVLVVVKEQRVFNVRGDAKEEENCCNKWNLPQVQKK